MKIITTQLDGKMVAYCSETKFLVQVGRGPKGGYKTSYSFKGDLAKAVFYYNCINIGRGYKKRLTMPASNKPILARQSS